MSATSPLVSVVLPVRDGERWLRDALDGLWRQTFHDFEVVAIDDGSTDRTPHVLAAERDPRLRVLRTGGLGIARALNLGLGHAHGTFVARHDADDVSRPERLARQLAFLREHTDISVLATTCDFIDGDGQPHASGWVDEVRRQHDAAVSPEALARLLPVTCCVAHGSIMARRSVLVDAGGYRDDAVPADDYDLWLRLLPAHRFAKLVEPLYVYRLHDDQLGARQRARQTRQALRAKLSWLRRSVPRLPPRALLATRGHARGAAAYADAAPLAGFAVVDAAAKWDVMALTDVADWPAALTRVAVGSGQRVLGNFVVRPGLWEVRP